MTKTILGVLSLLVIMSCSIPVKENTVQPNIMETNKKNLGNLLALYPKPMTVVGAEVEGKVNCPGRCPGLGAFGPSART